jgi:hypothetical protein
VFAGPAERCSLYVDHHRHRKTGPRCPLAVVGCSVHPLGRFTLYPIGHVPYGRSPVVPCSPAGEVLLDAETGQPAWRMTFFAAALDAATGVGWPHDSPAGDVRRRRTQGRRLERAERLLGIAAGLADSERERVAARLEAPLHLLRTVAAEWRASWATRGVVIAVILAGLLIDARLPDRMLAAGAVAGLWPPPRRWDRRGRAWLPVRSRRPERGGQRLIRGRDPPPTNLRGALSGAGD